MEQVPLRGLRLGCSTPPARWKNNAIGTMTFRAEFAAASYKKA
jgi:hypothetical protein